MTVLSVAQAARLLGIDAKTLHRWLADAHLPLHCHPHDARKKGISQEQFQILARLHHRQAASVSVEPPPSLSSQELLLPPALLAVPEVLTALQAQVATLHLQMADLTLLLQQHAQPLPAPSTPSAKKPSPTPHSRPAVAKTPPKPRHVIPRVEYSEQGYYVVICPKKGLLSFQPDTQEWFAWVTEQSSFRFVGKGGHFTAHHWWRVPHGAWRAHRHIRNHNYVLRLAPNHELTLAVLEQAAEALQAHLA